MALHKIDIHTIRIQDSRFAPDPFLFDDSGFDDSLMSSFESAGILNPIVVCSDGAGSLHLVDGRKRVRFAEQKGMQSMDAVVFPAETPLTDIVLFVFSEKRTVIEASVVNSVGFVNFASSLDIEESWMFEYLCRPLGFRPHRSFLEECGRVHDLPLEIRRFCHEKRFSLRQVLNLTSHPVEVLEAIIRWKPYLHLSASILDELASNLKDCLRMNDTTLERFVRESGIQEIIESASSPRDRTTELRNRIRALRYPVLTEVNERIEKAVKRLDLPEGLTIEWDRTLENRGVRLNIIVKDMAGWTEIRKRLDSTEIHEVIKSILKEL